MSRGLAPLALLLFAAGALALAGDAPDPNVPWPQKGDVIYISATLSHVDKQAMDFNPTHVSVTPLTACIPLQITMAKPDRKKGPFWGAEDPMKTSTGALMITGRVSGFLALEGPWRSRMHRTEAECSEVFGRLGEPRVIHSGARHMILPAEPETEKSEPPPSP